MVLPDNIKRRRRITLSYKHLTPESREIILRGIIAGCSFTEISKSVGCNKSTVSREIKRNGGRKRYSCHQAQKRYSLEREKSRRKYKLLSDETLFRMIEERILKYWSPEQIVGRIKPDISVPTIYRAIRKNLFEKPEIRQYLRCKGKGNKRNKQEKRGKLSGCLSIDHRPSEAGSRSRIGDFEGDTVIGKHRTGVILSLVDRMSRFLFASRLQNKDSEILAESMVELLKEEPCCTITVDNGKEFAQHKYVTEELGAQVYFAHPHSPWERGTNVNTNKLLRQFIPKGSSMKKLTQKQLDHYVRLLNNRPRKCLNYLTPSEVYYGNSNCCT